MGGRTARRCDFPWLVQASHAHEEAPPGAVGRIEGNDISVDSGTPASIASAMASPSMFVANGGVITVHSGQARLMLASGGQIEICGPAKLTVLESSGAITIALNFGRVRSELPAATKLRIFTPSIIATPIDIGGAPRDIAVGLNLDDSLCVLATSGALELEHQFTGEKLIVPQTGEFFLASGQLLPVAGTPGSCQCAEMETRVASPAPAPAPLPSPQTPPNEAMLLRRLSLRLLRRPARLLHPKRKQKRPSRALLTAFSGMQTKTALSLPHPRMSVPSAPAVTVPEYTAVSPLTYSAADPTPPDPSPDLVLLIRTARVDPDWEFNGRVETPEFAKSMEKALGVTSAAPAPQARREKPSPGQAEKTGRGFWHGTERTFRREPTEARRRLKSGRCELPNRTSESFIRNSRDEENFDRFKSTDFRMTILIGSSHSFVIRAAATFGRNPIDDLIRVGDVAGLAVDAICGVDF